MSLKALALELVSTAVHGTKEQISQQLASILGVLAPRFWPEQHKTQETGHVRVESYDVMLRKRVRMRSQLLTQRAHTQHKDTVYCIL